MRPAPTLFLLCAFLALAPLGAQAQIDAAAQETIQRARAFLGTESALGGVRSIHFQGTYQDDKGNQGVLEIIVQRPMQERVTFRMGDTTQVWVMNDYEGFHLMYPTANEQEGRLAPFDASEVTRRRANIWENLNYFSGIDSVGGRALHRGNVTVDGVECVKVEFIHRSGTTFVRHFDRKTGRLVLTVTEGGAQVRESGEIIVAGVRFPKVLTTVLPEVTQTVTFDAIAVNGAHDPKLFAFPMLQ